LLELTCQLFYFGAPLLPTAIVHGLCIKYHWLKVLKKPMDFGNSIRGKRVFGDNKTWRGFVIHVLCCALGTIIQTQLQSTGIIPQWLPLLDYERHGLIAGVLMGTGMTLGELPNSFMKRRLAIPPGQKKRGILGGLFFLFDQVDLMIGIWVFLYFLVKPSLLMILWSFLLMILLHVAVSTTGFLLGMRKTLI
jgi:hypothetical protein